MSGEIEIHHHHYGDGNEPINDDGMSMADHAAGLAASVDELIRENGRLEAIAREATEDSIRLADENQSHTDMAFRQWDRINRLKDARKVLREKHEALTTKHDAAMRDLNRALKDAVGHKERADRFEQALRDYQIPIPD